MVEFMDRSGRIYRVRCEQYTPTGEEAPYSNCARSPDEVVFHLLRNAPPSSYLRGPYLSPDETEKKGGNRA